MPLKPSTTRGGSGRVIATSYQAAWGAGVSRIEDLRQQIHSGVSAGGISGVTEEADRAVGEPGAGGA